MSGYTPGPWVAVNNVVYTSRPDGSLRIATADTDATSEAVKDREESYANARLIAAAPDLLAELKRITKGFRHCIVTAGSAPEHADSAVAPALAVIAKAEGREVPA